MLTIISDIHLNDRSAAPENVPAAAFAMWLDEVLHLAEHNAAQELVFLYLGDIFDLIRTEHWFYPAPGAELTLGPKPETFMLTDRPWGYATVNEAGSGLTAHCRQRAVDITQRIVATCRDQLALLSGATEQLSATFLESHGGVVASIRATQERLANRGVAVRRFYIPGNHDRLCLVVPEVLRIVTSALGAEVGPREGRSPDGLSLHSLESERYGVIARHGHEWDVWNFEARRDKQPIHALAPALYELVPIGDPITTELVARGPYAIYWALDEHVRKGRLPPTTRDSVYSQLKHIEDVRPLHAAIKWLLVEGDRLGRQHPPAECELIKGTLVSVLKGLLEDFRDIPFVNRWLERHDRWNLGLDEADKLQAIDRLVHLLNLKQTARMLDLVDWLKEHDLFGGTDECARGVVQERLLGLDPAARQSLRYCVYGHTHAFRQEPLACDQAGDETVYFNSGTWRKRVFGTRDGKGFVPVKEMGYLIFYGADEDRLGEAEPSVKGTSYETWQGFMLKRARHPAGAGG